MKTKFNHYERMAGIFVLGSIISMAASFVGVAIKQGWFELLTEYHTVFEEADGIHTGTNVVIAGLKAGNVDSVELTEENKILVKFRVFSRFDSKIRQDSTAQLVRPFILSERILEVSVGSLGEPELGARKEMKSVETVDIVNLMSGKKLGVLMSSISDTTKNLRYLAESILDKERTQDFIKIFDRINPLVSNLNIMAVEVSKLSRQANRDDSFGKTFKEMAVLGKEFNEILPEFKGVLPVLREKAPQLARDMERLVTNLNDLTEQFKLLTPAIAEVAPELPRASRRAIEALDETVVLLKSMQKSFLLRSSAEEVRAEEKRKQNTERKPAAEEPK